MDGSDRYRDRGGNRYGNNYRGRQNWQRQFHGAFGNGYNGERQFGNREFRDTHGANEMRNVGERQYRNVSRTANNHSRNAVSFRYGNQSRNRSGTDQQFTPQPRRSDSSSGFERATQIEISTSMDTHSTNHFLQTQLSTQNVPGSICNPDTSCDYPQVSFPSSDASITPCRFFQKGPNACFAQRCKYSHNAQTHTEKLTCGICFDCPTETEDKLFGILVNCDHVFCYRCILSWTLVESGDSDVDSERHTTCPICRTPSSYVYSSSYYLFGDEKTKKLATRCRVCIQRYLFYSFTAHEKRNAIANACSICVQLKLNCKRDRILKSFSIAALELSVGFYIYINPETSQSTREDGRF